MEKSEKINKQDIKELGLKIIEKLDAIPDVALKAGVAYTGIKATNHWTGGILGLVGLRLAQSGNLFAGASGVALLTWLGLTGWVDPYEAAPPDYGPGQSAPSGVGAGGGGYIPPIDYGELMNTQDCLAQGGSIISIIPNTNLCRCRLPVDVQEPVAPRPPGGIWR